MTDVINIAKCNLQFAVVTAFNADCTPVPSIPDSAAMPYYGDGSKDMTGTVQLMDGTTLPFDYNDGREVRRYDGVASWDTSYEPSRDGHGMKWPFESYAIMVQVKNNRVHRWAWPSSVLDSRSGCPSYLAPPIYRMPVRFPGLHCLVDITNLEVRLREPQSDFPPGVVYIGHTADYYLACNMSSPAGLGVFTWDTQTNSCRMTEIVRE